MEEVIGSLYTFALFGSFLLGVVVTFIGKSYLDSYIDNAAYAKSITCLLYTSPSPRDVEESRMPSSA